LANAENLKNLEKPANSRNLHHSRGSGSRGKHENLDRIDKLVTDSFQRLTVTKESFNHAASMEEAANTIDVSLWRNMIFYKSIAHVTQQLKKHDPSQKLQNHYANVPSKVRAYIRKPME
jgi:hypothetical protein